MLKILPLLLLFASSLSAENYSIVRGIVTNAEGAPVANAQITLNIYNDGQRQATTDALGRYLITDVNAPGGWSYVVTIEGKKPGAVGFFNRTSNQKDVVWIDIKVAD